MSGQGYAALLARLETARTLGVSLGLERVRRALDDLGAPDRRFASVQVAGTNGKGSTAAMAEAILRAAGLRVGLFTSPHLCRFTERIRIDGREVDGEELAALDEAVVATGVPLTYFEISAVLALRAMAEAGVEVAVLETGLGGRLDAVTAVTPVATAITSIGLDHSELLGPTLREIAREKAGIAKPGVPLYIGALPGEAEEEVARVAAAVGAPLRRDRRDPETAPALRGAHQIGNAALAIALAEDAARARGRALSREAIAAGLAAVTWPGRLEWVTPDVLLDCAHNAEGARALAAALGPPIPRALVISVVRGKDLPGILSPLVPHFALVVATRAPNDRALPPEAIAAVVPAGPASEVIADPIAALARARAFAAAARAHVVVAGSIFLVGHLRAVLRGETCDPGGGGDPLP